jgi:hypothetical protein
LVAGTVGKYQEEEEDMSSALSNALLGLICIESMSLRTPGALTRYYLGRYRHKQPP